MPLTIPNTTISLAAYDKTQDFGGTDVFAQGYLYVANNPVYIKWLFGKLGFVQPMDELFYPPGQYSFVSNPLNPIAGIRVRAAGSATPLPQLFGMFFYPVDPVIAAGIQFGGVVKPDGTFVPPSSGGGSLGAAAKARATSWYGLGDDSSVNGSVVKNYSGGANASLGRSGADVPIPGAPPPATTGIGVPWALRSDGKSFQLPEHVDTVPTAPDNSMGRVPTTDVLDTTVDFSVNFWAKVAKVAPLAGNGQGYTMFHDYGFGKGYFQTGIYGRCTSPNFAGGGRGITFGNNGQISPNIVNPGDPRPAQNLAFTISDGGAGFTSLQIGSAGAGLDDGAWHMVTGTYKQSTKLMSLYLDGVLFTSATRVGGSVNCGAGDLGNPIIGIGSGASENFVGYIDELGVWSTECLTADMVAALFAGT